eukprot:9475472-Pyramimonas_sp.AAC.1
MGAVYKFTSSAQEMSDARLRLSAPGESLTVAEKSAFQEKCRLFFKRTQLSEPERKKRFKALVKGVPRMATAEWLKIIDRALRSGCGFGLERFQNVSSLRSLGVCDGTQTGVVNAEALVEFLCAGPTPACLALVSDQESKRISGCNFAKDNLELTAVLLGDWFHRCWNDLNAAVRRSGLHS